MLNPKTFLFSTIASLSLVSAANASLQADDIPAGPPAVAAPQGQDPAILQQGPVVAQPHQPTVGEAAKDLGKAIEREVKPAAEAAKQTYKQDVKPAVQDVKQETSVIYKKSEKEVKRGLHKLGLKKKKKK